MKNIISPGVPKKEFPALWFYCNWALHVIIDKKIPASTYKMLLQIKDGTDYSGLRLSDFHSEFKTFLKKNGLPETIYTEKAKRREFEAGILAVYSRTPLLLKKDKYQVEIDKIGGMSFSPYSDIKNVVKELWLN